MNNELYKNTLNYLYRLKEGKKTYNELLSYLIKAKNDLNVVSNSQKYQIIKEIYLRCKIDYIKLLECNQKSLYFSKILSLILLCEEYLKDTYIIDTAQSYHNPGKYNDLTNSNDLLNYIVYKVRKEIINEKIRQRQSLISTQMSKEIDCQLISNLVCEICKDINVKCNIIKIDPGFNSKMHLYHNSGYHYFNIIEIDGKKYLIDLSYIQFFKLNNNFLQRLGVVGLAGCAPGIYMLIDDERKVLANDLIKNGWIELNEKSIKDYFDGFTLSYRNGTYYELLGKIDYNTSYTSNDYFNFLTGSDGILNYEPKEGLGYQLKPLKNPYMRFDIKEKSHNQ